VKTILIASLFSLFVGPALAGVWMEPGDRRLREDIELLSDGGHLVGPTSVWPLPWAQVSSGLEAVSPARLNSAQAAAYARVKTQAQQAQDDTLHLTAILRGTTDVSLRRDFSDRARAKADVTVTAEQMLGDLYVKLAVNGRLDNDTSGDSANLDGSYAALALGNWALYGGFIDQWWGPSHEGAMLLSNNARPFPKFGITRLTAQPFKSRWLRWIGPWRFDGFVGVLTGKRRDPFKNPLVMGLRVTFEPMDGFEIGLSRLLQLCGRGRPCGFNTWRKALVPIGQPDNTGTLNEPGNQAAGIDFRYHWSMGDTNAVIHFNGFAEDTLFEAASFQAGASLTGPSQLGTWRVGVEAIDTYARIFSKAGNATRQRRTTYLNSIYRDGFAYRGKPFGFTLDGDARLYTATASLTDPQNRRWFVSLNRADINITSAPDYRVSQTREKFWLGEAGVDWPSPWGDIAIEARAQSDSPNTPGRKEPDVQAELRWTVRY
jgi:Capsule assembly protein Wzi